MSLTAEIEKRLEPIVPWEELACLLWHNDALYITATSSFTTTPSGVNGKLYIWDKNLEPLGEFQAHKYPIYHMCSGPGNTIYTSSSDSVICHWQCSSLAGELKLLKTLRGHLEPPWRLRYLDNRLFSGDGYGEVRLWVNDVFAGVLETYEEIWDMVVIKRLIFTVRFHDVVLTVIPDQADDKKACSVKNTIPGRGPLHVSGDFVLCQNRHTFDIMVHSISQDKNPLLNVLSGHKALINSFAGSDTILLSGDYEGRVIAWDLLGMTKIAEISLPGNGCVNAMTLDSENAVYVAQEKKCLTKLILVKK